MIARFAAVLGVFAVASAVVFAQTFTVTVVAVDTNKKPVAKAEPSMFWEVKDGKMTAATNAKPLYTGEDGRVKMVIPDWNEKRPLLVLTEDRTLGGWAGVSKADDGKDVTITLGPVATVKGKLGCADLGVAPKWANTYVTKNGYRAFCIQNVTKEATFEFVLPVGEYTVTSYGEDVKQVKTPLAVTTDRSEFDLGTIDLKAAPLALLKGKAMPEWTILDARGVKKEIKVADYKGKWVYLDFWGFWCGPCVAQSLPELIGLSDDHKEHRDQFEIIAFHDSAVKTFAELDPKLVPIKKQHWQNRDLPFPILIDKAGATVKELGISHFPTGLLIDPEGKLVGEVSASDFEKRLPPLPAAKLWARHRDLSKNVAWEYTPEKYTLAKLAMSWTRWTDRPVELDGDAVKAAGLSADSPLNGYVLGYGISMRSHEALLLTPFGLGIVPSADGKTLRMTAKPKSDEAKSYLQTLAEGELAERLNRDATDEEKQKGMKPLAIDQLELFAALKRINVEYEVPFAVDAKALKEKRIDPAMKLSGTLGPGQLGKGLSELLKPAKLKAVVRNEVIWITTE